ncbi:hypothetical protein RUM44_000959 [Polyplax serrata]|uniref:Uncharacterized protein n=1 Tax=Polyplax serrata TaxID=468196 RepID=A0ABR1B6F9_POLSC
MNCDLSSMYGIRYYSPVPKSRPDSCGSSRDTLSPNGSLTDSPVPLKVCGPLTLFSFVLPAKHEKVSYSEQKQYLKSAIEESTQFHGGLLLVTKEKGGKQEK